MPEKKEKKQMPLYVKIFVALFSGIVFGFILNFMGGVNNPTINNYILISRLSAKDTNAS